MAKLLLVDDEPNLLYSLEQGLAVDDLEVVTAATGRQAIALAHEQAPDAVILDIRLPDMTGLEVFDALREMDAKLPVIVITAFTTTTTAIEATKRGAFEYLLKPVDLHVLRETLDRALAMRRLQRVPAVFESDPSGAESDPIVGRSPAMQEVYKAVGRVAPTDTTVLILGESGTGKELIARAVYQHSARKDQPFLAINCAAIPESLLESELFGHEKGAFTGADRKRIGKFEQANGGTLFLDEIGDMPPATQAKMLRLLQEQKFDRVGGSETIHTDVRVIAATNQPLETLVNGGTFRADLFYRLNGFTISLPPLRDRMEDLPLLVEHFLQLANEKLGKSVRTVAPEAERLLRSYPWPGNIRELQSAIRYAVVQTVGDVITADGLPASLRGATPTATAKDSAEFLDIAALVQSLLQKGSDDIYRQVTQAVDQIVLAKVLEYVGGNQVQASELLGVSRTTLRAKLQQLGMVVEKHVRTEPLPKE